MVRRTQADWQRLIDEQASSGLSVAAFCQERGVNVTYFYLRCKQLSRASDEPPTLIT